MWYALALYGIPVLLALVSLGVGALGFKFYWDTIVRNTDTGPGRREPREPS